MIIVYALLFGLLIGAAAIIKTPWFKGWEGEAAVNLGLKWFLDKRNYRLVRNVTLPAGEGTTQIDHVVVSRYGVFVIETKNMKGAIYGGEHDEHWTQAMGRSKHKFMNPLRQNYKHTKTLAEVLGIPQDKMKSVIILIGDATLKTRDKLPPNVLTRGVVRFIKSHREELLAEAEVDRILEVIQARRLTPGRKTNRRHVQHVKKIKAARRSIEDP